MQAPPALRQRIARTVHEVKVDGAGCPVSDPVSLHPEGRPRPASDVASRRGVTAVSVCRYEIVQEGGGPDNPKQCLDGYGSDMFVLRIQSSVGETLVHVRYSGCDHHGFDDGSTIRQLTRAPMQRWSEGRTRCRAMGVDSCTFSNRAAETLPAAM